MFYPLTTDRDEKSYSMCGSKNKMKYNLNLYSALNVDLDVTHLDQKTKILPKSTSTWGDMNQILEDKRDMANIQ